MKKNIYQTYQFLNESSPSQINQTTIDKIHDKSLIYSFTNGKKIGSVVSFMGEPFAIVVAEKNYAGKSIIMGLKRMPGVDGYAGGPWSKAKQYCENLELGGIKDWWMGTAVWKRDVYPNISILKPIIDSYQDDKWMCFDDEWKFWEDREYNSKESYFFNFRTGRDSVDLKSSRYIVYPFAYMKI